MHQAACAKLQTRTRTAGVSVAREQLPSGAFYPSGPFGRRTGLYRSCSQRYERTYRRFSTKTIDWLLLDTHRGGACDAGLWLSGTKPWNSDLEVTAMTLLACVASGIDPDDDRLKSPGVSYFAI